VDENAPGLTEAQRSITCSAQCAVRRPSFEDTAGASLTEPATHLIPPALVEAVARSGDAGAVLEVASVLPSRHGGGWRL
jgi:hypothetical protein